MPKRTYWDRTLFKDVREIYKPIKEKSKRRQKRQNYQSLGYRAFLSYLRKRFGGSLLGLQIAEDLYTMSNRHGFMRRYFAAVHNEKLPEPVKKPRDPRLVAYEKEFRPYKRKSTYVVPEKFLTFDEELQLEQQLIDHQRNIRYEIRYQGAEHYGIVDELALPVPNLSTLAKNGVPLPNFQQIKKGHDELVINSLKFDKLVAEWGSNKPMKFESTFPILNPQSLAGIFTTNNDLLYELYDKATTDLYKKVDDALAHIPKDQLKNYSVDIVSEPSNIDGNLYIDAKITKKEE